MNEKAKSPVSKLWSLRTLQATSEVIRETSLGVGRWDRQIRERIVTAPISFEAKKFLNSENQISESGRHGFLGAAIYLMEGYPKKNPDFLSIWCDTSFHHFTGRVFDDYIDKEDEKSSVQRLDALR